MCVTHLNVYLLIAAARKVESEFIDDLGAAV